VHCHQDHPYRTMGIGLDLYKITEAADDFEILKGLLL